MKISLILYVIGFYIICTGCTKTDFLSAKPNEALVIPKTLEDLQAILDNDIVMNGAGHFGVTPAFGEIGADNYYVTDDRFNATLKPLYRNAYTWAKDVYAGEPILDWNLPYRAVFYANEALQGVSEITPAANDLNEWNNIKGSALFYRAFMFYNLAQVFAPPYNDASASTDLGIPLRLIADVNEKISRSTIAQTYGQVITDLQSALPLLPVQPLYKTRPGKPAVYAMLARVYQTMEHYDTALLYADSCLQLHSALLDYNAIDKNAVIPFTIFNDEVIYNSTLQTTEIVPILPSIHNVDTVLFKSYNNNDLRKAIFYKMFSGAFSFLGSYDGSYYPFGGLAADEAYLIKAECEARAGSTTSAMNTLNSLLEKRWKKGHFIPLTATDADDALNQVLIERRKELVMRGLRWTDLRRLNKDPRFAITLTRKVNGQTYMLPPNDLRYTYPIPDDVIGFNPDMPQNPR